MNGKNFSAISISYTLISLRELSRDILMYDFSKVALVRTTLFCKVVEMSLMN